MDALVQHKLILLRLDLDLGLVVAELLEEIQLLLVSEVVRQEHFSLLTEELHLGQLVQLLHLVQLLKLDQGMQLLGVTVVGDYLLLNFVTILKFLLLQELL